MSKIVCDVCGATYPETENQCPICGTVKSDTALSAENAAGSADSGYAYVKGGRFSKANVKKRNSGNQELPRTAAPVKEEKPRKEKKQEAPKQEAPAKEKKQKAPKQEAPAKEKKQKEPKQVAPSQAPARRERKQEKEGTTGNIVLIILVIIMVLAIVAICAYIIMDYIDQLNPNYSAPPAASTTQPSGGIDIGGSNGPVSIPCTGLRLSMAEYTFANVGDTLLLDPDVQPENTTEQIVFISGDERIATVDDDGKVTAVADGETIIYVACGSFKAELTVVCNVGVAPDQPTDPTDPTDPTQPTEPFVELKLNRTEFSLSGYGSSWNVYSGTIDRTAITWTSSDEEVATVTDGKVVAVGNGYCTITAEYKGQVVTCKVYCNDVMKASFTLSRTEFSLNVGESYTLQAFDAEGLRIDPSELTFTTEAEGFFTVDETGKITGVKSNYGYLPKYTYVYVEYDGQQLKCIVRVN